MGTQRRISYAEMVQDQQSLPARKGVDLQSRTDPEPDGDIWAGFEQIHESRMETMTAVGYKKCTD